MRGSYGVTLTASTKNLVKHAEAIGKLGDGVMRQVVSDALNDAGRTVQKAMREELRAVFDNPTRYIANSPKVAQATPANLQVLVVPTAGRADGLPTKGGKVGVDPQQILQAQEFGGRRADKKSEVILRRMGWLPHGWQTAIPDDPFPGSVDAHGNLRGAFIQQVLSYLQAFGNAGSNQNMGADKRAQLQKYGVTGKSKRHLGSQHLFPNMGRRYFVSLGKLREQTRHLPMGIYASLGTGQSRQTKAVLFFVRSPNYRPRLSMERLAKSTDLQGLLDRKIRHRTYQALEKAGLK